MKIFLIQAKNKDKDRFIINPPYGLLYLASVLRENNISVNIYDANLMKLVNDVSHFDEISKIIDRWDPDIVGIGGMISSFKFAKQLSYFIKERYSDLTLIAGGLLISTSPVLVMKNTSIDIGCIGEAEEIIVELVKRIYAKESLEDIPGLVLRKNHSELLITGSSTFLTGRRKRTRSNIDWIPIPSYDLIDLKQYLPFQSFCDDLLKSYIKRRKMNSKTISNVTPYAMPIFAGRGCPFNCIFCFSSMDKTPIKHSVDYVINHIEYLETNYGINHFQFMDENFNYYQDWVIEFCKKIIEKGNKYYFTTGNRNRVGFFTKEMLELMKKAHFYDISVGVESLDDSVLREMNRGMSSEKIVESLKMISDAGIQQEHLRCLSGFPSDTRDSIFRAIKKGNQLGYKTLFALVMPLPGTNLYSYCVDKGLIKNELDFLEEIYTGDGYRNMTSFKSFSDLLDTILKANRYSELNYCLRKKQYLSYLKLIFIQIYRIFNRQIIKGLDFLHIKNQTKNMLKCVGLICSKKS